MARIVLVHGAFNELWGPNELKARWLPAVRDGLWHHGIEVSEHDVDVCFYGDLFRRHPGTDEEELLEKARPGIAEVLRDLEGAAALAAIADAASEAVFERTVDMVTVMTAEPDMRDRPARAVEAGDPRRHPRGGRALLRDRGGLQRVGPHPEWPVRTFVTLGSPMAAPTLRSLNPPPVDGRGAWPGSVERWVNVRALNDKACASSLTDKFGPRVEEVFVDNGHRIHAPEPYLQLPAARVGASPKGCVPSGVGAAAKPGRWPRGPIHIGVVEVEAGGTMASMRSSTSGLSRSSRAGSWDSRCSMVRGPMMGDVTAGCSSTKPSASSMRLRPASSASAISCPTASTLDRLPTMVMS